jgi:hypothetical protein
LFEGLFILGVLLDAVFRISVFNSLFSINWWGGIALGIAALIAVIRYAMDKAKAKK